MVANYCFVTLEDIAISVDSSSFLFYICDALFIPLNYYYFNFLPV